MAIKRHKLEHEENYNFLLFGISSPENDYRLAWSINQNFSLNFERAKNLVQLIGKKGQISEFAVYLYDDDDTFYLYHLISNKSENGALLDELKNIDYLIKIQGEFTEPFANGFFNRLKTIENIQAVFRISPAGLKNRERLIF
jgi:hypothetical protein